MLLLLLTLFLMVGRVCMDENVIKLSMLRKHVFKDAPKNWFAYIDKLLHRTVVLMLVNIELHLNGSSVDFISLKSYLILYHKKRIVSFLHVANNILQPTINIWNSSLVIQKPFGKIEVDQNAEDLYDPKWVEANCESLHQAENLYKYEYYWSFQWKFLLDKHLNINLTFEYIHISINNNFECYIGKLEIKDLHNNNSSFVYYCGIHSNMITYPNFQYVNLQLSIRSFVSCQIQLSFAVTDPNRIVSFIRQFYKAVNPVWSLYFNQPYLVLEKFHLLDQKFKYFNITFSVENSFTREIFDGPGTLSKIIQPHFQNDRQVYMTSTFQCIIYVYLESMTKGYDIAFNTITIPVQSEVMFNNKDEINYINYPNCSRNSDICVIMIKAMELYKINLTVNSVISTLKRNDLCSYGRLSTFDNSNQSKAELSTLCMNHSFVHKYENIYTTQSSMLLILYSYPEFGKLSITVELRASKCKLVNFNTCMSTEFTVTFPETGCIVYQFSHEFQIKVY